MAEHVNTRLAPGAKFGDYTIVRLLGSGGMGTVFLIRGDRTGNEFALKILDPEVEKSDDEYKRRFLFEAELALSIHHPNLIAVYDVGRDPDTGFAYIIMEYVPGGTVRDRIDKWGALSVEEACDIVSRVAQALVAVDAHHIVHRDIKPDNIMFTADGVTPKLADLGIARLSTSATRSAKLTQSGYLVGSPAYMSPEQMLDSHKVDIRADIHALGITFWEMLAGRRPHPSDESMELVARAMRHERIPDIRTVRPDVSAGLAILISKMCHPNVAKRIQKPQHIVDTLEHLRRHPDEPVEVEPPVESKRPFSVLGLCLGIGSLLAGLFVVAIAVVALVRMTRTSLPPGLERMAASPTSSVPKTGSEPVAASEIPVVPAGTVGTNVPSSVGTSVPDERPSAHLEDVSTVASNVLRQSDGGDVRPSATATLPSVTAADFTEVWTPEFSAYTNVLHTAASAEEAAAAVRNAVDAARRFDPDLRRYDLDGESVLDGDAPLPAARRAAYRTGKVFLMLELLRREYADILENYVREKAKAVSSLPAARPLSLADTAVLLGRAVGHDMVPFFKDFGLKVDPSESIFRSDTSPEPRNVNRVAP